MCWCPFGNADGCSDPSHFVSEAGLLTIRGPLTLGFNATCVANQQPSCVVGPIEDGFGLSYGSDRVILVSSDGICGASEADPAVAGGAAGKQVGVDKFLQFSPEELPYGGSWKLCYCAGFDSPLDQEAQNCVSEADFTATAGFLTVAGAFPGQVINCTRNEACEFNLPGYSLNAGVHKIAIRDESSGSCGDFLTIDTATRRRRDVAANPYTPTGVTQDGELAFAIEPIQALDAFVVCFCAPSPGGGLCSTSSLSTYHQTIGVLDVRGATPNQQFSCGRGGRCTLEITGRGLGVSDRVKIVNSTTLCSGEPQETGQRRQRRQVLQVLAPR
ncbi:agaA33 [Symbiodinium sp. CCMP2456]|nr:agaA33 [Symbiodinium sp. CCMP2456]